MVLEGLLKTVGVCDDPEDKDEDGPEDEDGDEDGDKDCAKDGHAAPTLLNFTSSWC